MDDAYGTLRAFADSWALLLMVLGFAFVVIWVFRPGGTKVQDDAARQIFRNEDSPKKDGRHGS
jgi:cytochrome c oxidase cbb3-type subunit 4